MQIKRIALGGIIMTVIMFSGCSTIVQNLAIGEEKTLETGKTEQESVTEKDINMNVKESFNAEKLQIDMTDYSLWGGSAGARMATWLGSYGTAYFGEKDYPAPAAAIMQYTGLSQVTGMEPPTYACVGTSDGIASYRSMENYISQIQQNGTNATIEVFKGLSHGFGLGEGTVAEGWIDRAISFWEDNMNALDKR